MPRYHFDLVDHTTVEHKGGQILADDIVAAGVADELARRVYEVRPELHGKGYSILVTNADVGGNPSRPSRRRARQSAAGTLA
jgi:hypothetical protein